MVLVAARQPWHPKKGRPYFPLSHLQGQQVKQLMDLVSWVRDGKYGCGHAARLTREHQEGRGPTHGPECERGRRNSGSLDSAPVH